MISFLILFSLSFLPNIIFTSVPFIINPGCHETECEAADHPALYHGSQSVGDDTIHMIYSSFDDLTIHMCQISKGHDPIFDYKELFNGNYNASITFTDTKPINSLTIVLRRLIEFNDTNDDGLMDENDNIINTYPLKDLVMTNNTFKKNNTDQPTFEFPVDLMNGSLIVDIVYPGEAMRDKKFPKLKTAARSFFINIGLNVNNFTLKNTRFAFEFYVMLPGSNGAKIFSSRFIDDQYTPGIFKVWQMRTLDSLYPSSMLWKPVVYQSEDRTIEQNTLMKVYPLTNNVTLNATIDRGIFNAFALYPKPYVSAFNISLGQAKDGFYTKSNYTFVQFTAGLDLLEIDSTKQFVSIALIVSLALPAIVAIIAVIFIIKRRMSQQHSSSYDAIDD